MVVPDSNILVDFFLGEPCFNEVAQRGWEQDPEWICPALWRYEFGNVLLSYVRKRLISLDMMESFIIESEKVVRYTIDKIDTVNIGKIAINKNLSFYDASNAWLAQEHGVRLWTRDRRLLDAYPEMAVTEL